MGSSDIPAQYKDLPSHIVEELWVVPVYTDPEKTKQEQQRRADAIEQLKKEEAGQQSEDKMQIDKIRKDLGVETQAHLTEDDITDMQNAAYAKYKLDLGDVNTDLMIQNIDPALGKRFDAHGITKVSVTNQLRQLIDLLGKGIDPSRPFHTAPLEIDNDMRALAGAGLGTPGGTAYKDGSFVIMGPPDGTIQKDGIRYVLVNDAYYDAVTKLQSGFPGVRFIRADKANEELRQVVQEWDAQKR